MNSIKQPKHYQLEGIPEYEVKDFIRAILGKEGWINACRANVLKYMARAEKKGGEEDCGAGRFYTISRR